MQGFWIGFYVVASILGVYGLVGLALDARDVIRSTRPPDVEGPVLYQEANVRCRSRTWWMASAHHATVIPSGLRLDANRMRTKALAPYRVFVASEAITKLSLSDGIVRIEVNRPVGHESFELRSRNPAALLRALERVRAFQTI